MTVNLSVVEAEAQPDPDSTVPLCSPILADRSAYRRLLTNKQGCVRRSHISHNRNALELRGRLDWLDSATPGKCLRRQGLDRTF